jgi:hypothetical protein
MLIDDQANPYHGCCAAIALAAFTTMPAKAAEIKDRTACSVEQSTKIVPNTCKQKMG